MSTNGTTWSAPVAHGTWPDTNAEKTVTFAAVSARYVRLTATTEAGNRGPWSSAAEINLLAGQTAPPAGVLPRTGWVAAASDEEVTRAERPSQKCARRQRCHDLAQQVVPGAGGTAAAHASRSTPRRREALRVSAISRVLTDPNGRVGKYSIGVSTNGITWSAVASGTWPDTGTEKTVNFTAVSARYVRLTATTEAGNRGPWSSAAEINLLGPSQGSWGPTISFPLVPVAAALLPGNRMLTWSAYSPTAFGGSRGYTQTSILDLSTGEVTLPRWSTPVMTCSAPGPRCWRTGRS